MKQATRSLVTLVIVGVAAAVIAVVAWQRSAEKALAGGGDRDTRLFVGAVDEVTGIEITVKGNVARLEKKREGWMVTRPLSIGADEAQVDRLLRGVANMRVRTEFGTDEGPKAPSDELMGLAQPDAALTLFLGDKTWVFEKGAASEYNKEHYFRLTTPTGKVRVGTVSPSSAEAVERTWASFRDKRATGANLERVAALRVEPKAPSPDNIVYEVRRLPPDPSLPAYRQQPRFEAVAPPVGMADTLMVTRAMKSLTRAPLSDLVTQDQDRKSVV